MSLGLARRKEIQKRRAQRLWAIIRFIFIMFILIGVGYFAYDTGTEIAKRDLNVWKDKYELAASENEQLRVDMGKNEASLEQMQRLVPNDEIRDLLDVVNKKSTEGVAVSRMQNVIGGLTRNEECSDRSDVKRFIVGTLVNTQTTSTVSFERGLITISGRGSSEINENGNPEAWFDTAKPVTMTFALPGGDSQEKAGILPVYHTMVVKDQEYRFSITAGNRSFVNVTLLKCKIS